MSGSWLRTLVRVHVHVCKCYVARVYKTPSVLDSGFGQRQRCSVASVKMSSSMCAPVLCMHQDVGLECVHALV